MAKKSPIFKVIVNYPTPENKDEYDKRIAKAVAKVLIETVPLKKIDELIDLYRSKEKQS